MLSTNSFLISLYFKHESLLFLLFSSRRAWIASLPSLVPPAPIHLPNLSYRPFHLPYLPCLIFPLGSFLYLAMLICIFCKMGAILPSSHSLNWFLTCTCWLNQRTYFQGEVAHSFCSHPLCTPWMRTKQPELGAPAEEYS